jgi:hypothetical protein
MMTCAWKRILRLESRCYFAEGLVASHCAHPVLIREQAFTCLDSVMRHDVRVAHASSAVAHFLPLPQRGHNLGDSVSDGKDLCAGHAILAVLCICVLHRADVRRTCGSKLTRFPCPEAAQRSATTAKARTENNREK